MLTSSRVGYKSPMNAGSVGNGVTLAQLVKASVGQVDVQRFEPHLGHNLLSCFVFLISPGILGSLWHKPQGQIGNLS